MLAKWAARGGIALLAIASIYPQYSDQVLAANGHALPIMDRDGPTVCVLSCGAEALREAETQPAPARVIRTAQGLGRAGDDNGGGGFFGQGDPGASAGRGLEANGGENAGNGAVGNNGTNMGRNTGEGQGGPQGGDQGGEQGGEQGGTQGGDQGGQGGDDNNGGVTVE